ncbi:MAG TPA: diguanylate cyclase, partial [Kineosporiaceae bacterium]|nr:diguanylate cyclase [Kineosporiaceae bacterium]
PSDPPTAASDHADPADPADPAHPTDNVGSVGRVETPGRVDSGGGDRFRALFEHAAAGVALSLLDGRFEAVNATLRRLLDGSGVDPITGGLPDLVAHLPAGSDEARAWNRGLDAVRTGCLPTAQVEVSVAAPDADPHWVRATTALVVLGDRRCLLTHVEDTTSRRSAEQRAVELSLHDGLTQLAGRTLLSDRLEAALSRSAGTGLPVGVLYIALDDVARVNDVLGHQVGESVLVAVAERLAGLVRAGDTAGRAAAHSFLLIAQDVADPTALSRLAGRVSAALAAPLDVERARLLLAADVGAVLARPGDPVAAVLRRAQAAAAEAGTSRQQVARVELGELDLSERRITRLPDEASRADRPH